MGQLFADTAQAIEDTLIARLRETPPWRKLAMVAEMNAAGQQLLLLSLRERHPEQSLQALRCQAARLRYGAELAPAIQPVEAEESGMLPEPIDVMLRATRILEQLDIPYAVGGSMAAAAHGVARTTFDVDLVAAITGEDADDLIAALAAEFYLDEQMARDAIARQGSFNLIHNRTLFKVDIFVATTRAFDQQQLARRVHRVVAETQESAFLLSPEDVVLAKLDWYRLGNNVSDRQWQDVQGVLTMQRDTLDYMYLHEAAAELGVAALLEQALQERDAR